MKRGDDEGGREKSSPALRVLPVTPVAAVDEKARAWACLRGLKVSNTDNKNPFSASVAADKAARWIFVTSPIFSLALLTHIIVAHMIAKRI